MPHCLASADFRRAVLIPGLVCLSLFLPAQAQQAGGSLKVEASAALVSDESIDATREQLLRLVRLSPKLFAVVTRDPSLLVDQAYISRNNPALAKFLEDHPEVVRNPEFYLFANTRSGLPREVRLERDAVPPVSSGFAAFVVFLCILLSLLWLIRVLLENRRWSKIFNQQSQAHARLLEKFGTSEELLSYMKTDSGKRILELTPLSISSGGPQWNSPIARILTPLQFGVVFVLVGSGFLLLMHSAETNAGLDLGRPAPFLVFGILSLVLGIGLIVSAGLSWVFARQLGLLPQNVSEPE